MDTTAPGHEETSSDIVSDVRFGAVTRPTRPIANYHDMHVRLRAERVAKLFRGSEIVIYREPLEVRFQ